MSKKEVTTYAKVDGKEIVSIGLPETGVLNDGRTVSGYNLLPEKVLLEEGWLPVVDRRPHYNEETEFLTGPTYRVAGKQVFAEYEVETRVEPESPAPVQSNKEAFLAEIDNARNLEHLKQILRKGLSELLS